MNRGIRKVGMILSGRIVMRTVTGPWVKQGRGRAETPGEN
jgi:hypothetical protein